jgi:hypothetical protein
MAKKITINPVFIYREETRSLDKQEQILDSWMQANESDKILVFTEDNNGFLTNEEKDAVVVMEYVDYKEE